MAHNCFFAPNLKQDVTVGILLVWYNYLCTYLACTHRGHDRNERGTIGKYRNHEAPRSMPKVLVATQMQYWRKNKHQPRQYTSNYCKRSPSYRSIE